MVRRDSRGGLSRRTLLKGSAALLAAGPGCGSDESSEGDDYAPVPVPDGRAAVGIVAASGDIEHAVRRAIALAGGLEQIEPGQTVFIKPNVVHGAVIGLPGIVTSNLVLQAVIKAVKARKPGHVIVGDRSWRQGSSLAIFQTTGIEAAALEAGADEVYPAPRPVDDPDAWVLQKPPGWEETWAASGGILAMKKILEADHLIEVPVCKNHRLAAFSLSMKNLIGAIGDDSRDPLHFNETDPEGLSRDIAILNGIFAPTLVVLDALTALVNGGPEGVLGDRHLTEPGLILASRDRVALDAAGVAILKRELANATLANPDKMHPVLTGTPTWKLPQLIHGGQLGIGVKSHDVVDLRFDGVAASAELEALFRSSG